MKYKTLKALPWIEVGTVFEYNKDIITGQYGVTLIEWDNIWWLLDFINWFGIDNDFFEEVEEKRKSEPWYRENYYIIWTNWKVWECRKPGEEEEINQWNWRWTREEAEAEVVKRAAIERVRRYLVDNDLLKDNSSGKHIVIYLSNDKLYSCAYNTTYFYSPYGRLKNICLKQFIEDCREDLITIHS